MFLGWFWSCAVLVSVVFALILNRGGELTAALLDGAAQGVSLCISMAGPLALWAGLGKLLDRVELTELLAKALSPVLGRLIPASQSDRELAKQLSANVTANLLGLGNAATPMGIRAARRLRDPGDPTRATDGLCRLVVLNTASIQLLPTTIASVRAAAGSSTPFDILPAVWISSVFSVAAGLGTAVLLSRLGGKR